MTAPATSVLDCRGLASPLPAVRLAKAIKTMAIGGIIELFTTDRGSVEDIEAFEKQSGHKVIEQSERNGVYRFKVQRTR